MPVRSFGLYLLAAAAFAQTPSPVAVVSAAGFGAAVAPDSLASLFGADLTDRTAQAAPGGPLPLELDGVRVLVAGRPAGLVFVSSSQVNFWLPPGTPAGNAAVEVRNARSGAFAAGSVVVAAVAPGLFAVDCLRADAGAILNGITFAREPFAAETPANPGPDKRTRLSIFGTGIRHARSVEASLLDASGRTLGLAVEYAGPAPDFFGLDQVNVVLSPEMDALGVATLRLRADGAESNAVSVRLAPGKLLDVTGNPYSIRTVASELGAPAGLAVDRQGALYVADAANHVVRRIGPDGQVSTVAGNGAPGSSGDGGPAIQASLNAPSGVAVSPSGDLFVADRGNHKVRRVGRDGAISTFAGTGLAGSSGNGGPALLARLSAPASVAVDASGSVIVADVGAHTVRRITSDGWISRLAGTGERGFDGDGGPARLARLDSPAAVAVVDDGTIYVADAGNSRVRRISPDGTIRTAQAPRSRPDPMPEPFRSSLLGLAVDSLGELAVADAANHEILQIGAGCVLGPIAGTGERGFDGDGGPAFQALLDSPAGVAADTVGGLFVADSGNGRIRRLDRFAAEAGETCGRPAALAVSPRHAVAGQLVTATLRLNCAAEAEASIGLSSDLPGLPLPSAVVVPAGRVATSFDFVAPPVAEAESARLVAAAGAAEVSARLTFLPASGGFAIQFESTAVTGGETALGVVTLGAPAGPGGEVVPLRSENPAAARVAASVTVPEGQTRAAFLVVTADSDRFREIAITATTRWFEVSAPLAVRASRVPLILDFAIAPNPVRAGETAMGRIRLAGPAGPGGQLVSLSSSDPTRAATPATAAIPEGESAVEFAIATAAAGTVTISASGPNEVRRDLVVEPAQPGGALATLAQLDLLPNPVAAGGAGSGLVRLAQPAPPGGVLVRITSDRVEVSVPATITIPEGETRAFFRYETSPVAATTTALIVAASANSLGGTLTVTPAD